MEGEDGAFLAEEASRLQQTAAAQTEREQSRAPVRAEPQPPQLGTAG